MENESSSNGDPDDDDDEDDNDGGGGGPPGGGDSDGGGSSNESEGRMDDGEDMEENEEPFMTLREKLQGEFKNRLELRCDVSIGEILLNVLVFSRKHHITHTEKSDLMKMFQLTLGTGGKLPASRYLLDKYLFTKIHMWYNFFCFKCRKFLGSSASTSVRPKQLACPNKNCQEVNLLHDLSNASYFVTFDLKSH